MRNKLLSKSHARAQGAALVIASIIILLIASAAVFVLRSTGTFQKVTTFLRIKKEQESIALLGFDRAEAELKRRFEDLVNPENTTPVSNAQYRAIFDRAFANRVLTNYACDIEAIADQACATNVADGTDFGGDTNDIAVCLKEDPVGSYDYAVELLNLSTISDCCANGFEDTSCNADGFTRTVTDACWTSRNNATPWDDPSCLPPHSYHFGLTPPPNTPPSLGFRLRFRSEADEKGRRAAVEGDITVFIEPQLDFDMAAEIVGLDAFMLSLGTNIAGQARIVTPPPFLEKNWFRYSWPDNFYAPDYYLGNHYLYNPTAKVGPYDHHQPTIDPGYLSGGNFRELFTNSGVTQTLKDYLAAQAIPGVINEFANPDDDGTYSAVIGPTHGLPIAIDRGAIDRDQLITKINDYNVSLGVAPSLSVSASGGGTAPTIYVSDVMAPGNSQNLTNIGSTLGEVVADGRINRSVVLVGESGAGGWSAAPTPSTINGTGTVVIDGDLVIVGDHVVQDNFSLVVTGNTYIAGNILQGVKIPNAEQLLANPAAPIDYAQACAAAGINCSNLNIHTVGSVVIGNITNKENLAFMATKLSGSQVFLNVMPNPLDGLRPDNSTFTPIAERQTIYSNYQDLMQVGLCTPGNASCFSANMRHPDMGDQRLEETQEIGLLPNGAGSMYWDDAGNVTKRPFLFFRNESGAFTHEKIAFGAPINQNDYDSDVDGDLTTEDALGREYVGCGAWAQCEVPVRYTDDATNQGMDILFGSGIFPQKQNWGQDNPVDATQVAWINPITFQNLMFDGTTDNTSGNCNRADSSARGCAPIITPHTFETTTGPVRIDNITLDDIDPTQTPDSYISRTVKVEARLMASTITGWGGLGAYQDGVTGKWSPRFWLESIAGKPTYADLSSTTPGSGVGENPYLDRGDLSVCPNSNDCNNNGITFWGVSAKTMMVMSQGGMHFLGPNVGQPVQANKRKVKSTNIVYE